MGNASDTRLLIEEAKWLAGRLANLSDRGIDPICNLGSSTAHFRTRVQPWIDEFLFSRLSASGFRVVHVDAKAGRGVDIVGDLLAPETLARIRAGGFRSIICSNLLEHVVNPDLLAENVASSIPKHAIILATCPYAYPYHADPIDNRLRPTPEELAAMFPTTRMLDGDVVVCRSLAGYAIKAPSMFVRGQMWSLLPFIDIERAKTAWDHWGWMNRPFSASCVVLEKVE
jgi:hypothetical protein